MGHDAPHSALTSVESMQSSAEFLKTDKQPIIHTVSIIIGVFAFFPETSGTCICTNKQATSRPARNSPVLYANKPSQFPRFNKHKRDKSVELLVGVVGILNDQGTDR